MKYNKLVRDNIPDIIRSKGDTSKTHIATDAEYKEKLLGKLSEEVAEFKKDESIHEFADILEVMNAVAELEGFSMKEAEAIRQKKVAERGGFKKKIILDEA